MKQYQTLATVCGVLLAASVFSTVAAAKDKFADTTVVDSGTATSLDPGEEAHKIRQLVKLVLANNATDANRQALSDEITLVEKNKSLKEAVAHRILQDDDPDPTLPSAQLVRYPDGAVRGILFVQRDEVRGNNPNRIAWALDPKREKKEQGH